MFFTSIGCSDDRLHNLYHLTSLALNSIPFFQSIDVSIAATKALAVMSENLSSRESIGKLGR